MRSQVIQHYPWVKAYPIVFVVVEPVQQSALLWSRAGVLAAALSVFVVEDLQEVVGAQP